MMELTVSVTWVASCLLAPPIPFHVFGRWLKLPPAAFAVHACFLAPIAGTSPILPPLVISTNRCAGTHILIVMSLVVALHACCTFLPVMGVISLPPTTH